ncbi:unnamed protein product [Staurois parvus]|uniref:Uncharacterized protein n=1 Tax=Staurois parvus TaxID=386267 RepID=A0ABN9C7S7_9NEOB|nr:unnamed protein product [Staurois parvus]
MSYSSVTDIFCPQFLPICSFVCYIFALKFSILVFYLNALMSSLVYQYAFLLQPSHLICTCSRF